MRPAGIPPSKPLVTDRENGKSFGWGKVPASGGNLRENFSGVRNF